MPLLERIRDGTLDPEEASRLIQRNSEISQEGLSSESTLEQFANLDHDRARRTGFPEAVFAQGKTAHQVASILDDMAQRHVITSELDPFSAGGSDPSEANAILATR
jgi:pyridinium-3,5-biscarboxylic acid mononucleotide synthase